MFIKILISWQMNNICEKLAPWQNFHLLAAGHRGWVWKLFLFINHAMSFDKLKLFFFALSTVFDERISLALDFN